jgi:hypothetical protein
MKLQSLEQIRRIEVEEYGYCEDDKEAEPEITKAIAEGRHKEAEYDPLNKFLTVSVRQGGKMVERLLRLLD